MERQKFFYILGKVHVLLLRTNKKKEHTKKAPKKKE